MEGGRGIQPGFRNDTGKDGGVAEPAALQAPLREAVGNNGPIVVKVPFLITD